MTQPLREKRFRLRYQTSTKQSSTILRTAITIPLVAKYRQCLADIVVAPGIEGFGLESPLKSVSLPNIHLGRLAN